VLKSIEYQSRLPPEWRYW